MADKYGYIDARYYSFECSLDGQDVTNRCTRGNDLDGWVDLLPVDGEDHIISVETDRHRGEVIFTHVIADRQPLSIRAINDVHKLRERMWKLEIALENDRASRFADPVGGF